MVITRSWTRTKRSTKRDNATTSTHYAAPKRKPMKTSDENAEEATTQTSTFMISIPTDVIYALNFSSMQHFAVENVKVEHSTCEEKESTLSQSLEDVRGQEPFENNNKMAPNVVSSPVQFTDQTIPSDEVILSVTPIKSEHDKTTPNTPICNVDTMVSTVGVLYHMNVRPDGNVQQFQTPKRELLEHSLVDLSPASMLIEKNCGSDTVTADDDSATNTFRESTLLQSLKDLGGQETFKNDNKVEPLSPVKIIEIIIPSDEVASTPINVPHEKTALNTPTSNGETMLSIPTNVLSQLNARSDKNFEQLLTPRRVISEHNFVDSSPASIVVKYECSPNKDDFLEHPHGTYLTNYSDGSSLSKKLIGNDKKSSNLPHTMSTLSSYGSVDLSPTSTVIKEDGGNSTITADLDSDIVEILNILTREEDFSGSVKISKESPRKSPKVLSTRNNQDVVSERNSTPVSTKVAKEESSEPASSVSGFNFPLIPQFKSSSRKSPIDLSPASTLIKHEYGSPSREDDFLEHSVDRSDAAHLYNYSEERIERNDDNEMCHASTAFDSDIVEILNILTREEDFSGSVKISKESPRKSPKVLSTRNNQDVVSERNSTPVSTKVAKEESSEPASSVSGFNFPLIPQFKSSSRKSPIDLSPASTLIKHEYGSPSREDDFLEHSVDRSDAAHLYNYSEERIERNDDNEMCHASTAFDSDIVEILSGKEDFSESVNLSNENTRKSPFPAVLSTQIIQNIVLKTTPAGSKTFEKGQSSVPASFGPIFDFPIIPNGGRSSPFNGKSRVELGSSREDDFSDHPHLSNYSGKRNVSKKRNYKKKISSELNRGFNQKLSSNSKKTSHSFYDAAPLNSTRSHQHGNSFNSSAKRKQKKWFPSYQKRRKHGTDSNQFSNNSKIIPFKRRKIQSDAFRSIITPTKRPDIPFSPVSPEFSDSERLEDGELDYGWEDREPPKPEPQPKSTFEELDPSINEKMKIFSNKLRSEYDLDVIEASRKDLCQAIEDSIAIQSHKKLTELDQKIQKEKDDYARQLFGTDNFDSWDDDPALSNIENTHKLKQFLSPVPTDVHLMDKMCLKNVINVTGPTSASGENKFVYLSRIKQIKSQFNGQEWPRHLIPLIKNEKKIISDQVIKFLMPYYNAGRIQPMKLFGCVARKISHIFYETLEGEDIIKGYIDGIFLQNDVVTEHFLRT